MGKSLSRARWAFLVLLITAVGFVDAPLLRNGLPLGDDTEIHLYRLVDLDHLIRQGIIYSRWQPDLVYGYGYPLFTYYAPLSAYLTELFHLIGFSFRDGLAIAFGILPVVAGLATFAFLRRRLGPEAALLGAIAYPVSLYFLYNVYVRGSISDTLALALFPVVLLLADRVTESPGPGRAALLAFSYTALLLSHDISGPLLLPLLILCGLWWSRGNRPSLAWLGVGIGLGIGMALFFLGPAILGIPDTRVPEFLGAPGMHYDLHFLTPDSLLLLFAVARPGAMLTNLPIGLGLIPAILGLSALLGMGKLAPRLRGEIAIFALALVVSAGLTVPQSDWIWARLPLLQMTHYPWRLLAMATFVDALLIGYAAQTLLPTGLPRVRIAGLSVVAAILCILAVPYLYPLPGAELPANPSLALVTAFQQRSKALGSTSNSEFLPSGLIKFPEGPPFAGADLGTGLAEKLDPESVPSAASIQTRDDTQLSATLAVASPQPFLAHFFVFRFPGWTAQIDGRTAALGDPGPFQTLTVPVPAGQHTITVSFTDTRRQQAFELISLLALVATVVTVGFGFRRPVNVNRRSPVLPLPQERELGASRIDRSAYSGLAVLAVIALLMAALFWAGIFDRGIIPLVKPFNGSQPPGMAVAATHRFGAGLELLGYTLRREAGHSSDNVTITLYWRTQTPLTTNYSSFVHVIADNGQMVAQSDNVHVADFPTSRWRVGAYATDIHPLTLPATLASSGYRVDVGIYDRSNQAQLSVDGGPSRGSSAAVSLFRLGVDNSQ